MPWSYFIDLQQKTVFTRLFGQITPVDVQNEMNAVKSDPNFSATFLHLVDAFDGSLDNFPTEKVREFAGASIFSNDTTRAIVVKGDLAFGLARMFATYRDIHGETKVHVFRSRKEALSWLGVSEPNPAESTPIHSAPSAG